MIINYIILAYDHPDQLYRLVQRLKSDETFFYVHIDKKSNIVPFKKKLPQSETVTYVSDKERVDCRWGDISLVTAVLTACKIVLKVQRGGYVVLLSGQDYPIRSNAYIHQFFETHKSCDFLSIYQIPDMKKKSEQGGLERFTNYTFDCNNPNDRRMKAKISPLSFNLKTLGGFIRLAFYRRNLLPMAFRLWFKRRSYPQVLTKVFNEFWFALRFDTIKYIVDFWQSHPEVEEYYKLTHIPDEMAFGSILCADDAHKEVLYPMCHLIDWNENQNGSPRTFHSSDIPWINEQKRKYDNLLFARKFEYDDAVLNLLDQNNGYKHN